VNYLCVATVTGRMVAGRAGGKQRHLVFLIGEKLVLASTTALRERFMGKDRRFSKKYLKLLVEEIRYQNKQLVMKGSYAAVAKLVGESTRGPHRVECPILI
jgi:hypothetical protein